MWENFFQARKNPGIVTNLPTTNVVWSIGRNVRFRPGAIYKSLGKTVLATLPSPVPARNAFTFIGFDGILRTVVCCDANIYSYTNDFGTRTDITPATPPTSGADDVWQFAMVAGALNVSNGINPIWIWGNYSAELQLLSGAPTWAKAITTSMGRLMLGNIKVGGYTFIGRVMWSEPGVPTNFVMDHKQKVGKKDVVNAGEGNAAQESILAFGQTGLRKIVFTDANVWTSDPNESIFDYTWRIPPQGEGVVLIGPRAQVHVQGINYFMATDDFYQIDGEGITPFGLPIRNVVFPNLNKSKAYRSFAFYKPTMKDVYFCYPTGSSEYPDTAAIYNTELKNWSFEDVDYLCHTAPVLQTAITWDTLPYTTWDDITDSRWDDLSNTGVLPYDVVGDSEGNILKMDDGNNNKGVAIEGYIETGDFFRADAKQRILSVVPFLKPQETTNTLFIQVGGRDNLSKSILWSRPKPFTIGAMDEITSLVTGWYTRLRFFSDQKDSPWILEGYKYFHQEVGGR